MKPTNKRKKYSSEQSNNGHIKKTKTNTPLNTIGGKKSSPMFYDKNHFYIKKQTINTLLKFFKKNEIKRYSAEELAEKSKIDLQTCKKILALAIFQTLYSVGPAAANDLVEAGCYSLEDVADRSPYQLFLKAPNHTVPDPCVFDVFMSAVSQSYSIVKHKKILPNKQSKWSLWTTFRKKSNFFDAKRKSDERFSFSCANDESSRIVKEETDKIISEIKQDEYKDSVKKSL